MQRFRIDNDEFSERVPRKVAVTWVGSANEVGGCQLSVYHPSQYGVTRLRQLDLSRRRIEGQQGYRYAGTRMHSSLDLI